MKRTFAALILPFITGVALAQVEVTSAWARPAVPGQSGTGAFMTVRSKDGARLIGVASQVAGVVELHEMSMDGNVMKMRAIPSLELPAGREVQLKPGGTHVMLLDLKRPVKAGEKIRLELQIETRDGRRLSQPVEAEVRMAAPGQRPHGH